MKQRIDDAKNQKRRGDRAYSDAFDHVIVNMHGTEYGLDLACAIRLMYALNGAIINAAKSDDEYT
jgi:hypothetical protein